MFLKRGIISLAKPIIDRFPRLANFYRGIRDQLSLMEKPIITPWGFKLSGNASMANGAFEAVETEVVRKILNDVDVLVNVGANIGYYCCHALSVGKSVIAFEPMHRNLTYLCQNIKLNGWSGCEIFPLALSNTVGILEMFGADTGASLLKGWAGIPESYVTFVPVSTLDVVLGTRLNGKKLMVIIDIEGTEKFMIEGASLMLASKPKPVWMVEILTEEHQPSGVRMNPHFRSTFQLFFQNGYRAYNIDTELRLVTMEHVDQIVKGNLKLSTHNFLFSE
jgi:FkbM family methyltransferase